MKDLGDGSCETKRLDTGEQNTEAIAMYESTSFRWGPHHDSTHQN